MGLLAFNYARLGSMVSQSVGRVILDYVWHVLPTSEMSGKQWIVVLHYKQSFMMKTFLNINHVVSENT